MRCVSFYGIAGSQAPAVLTITFVPFWIFNAVLPVDQGMVAVILPIVRILIAQPPRVEAEIRIVRPEQGAAELRCEVVLQGQVIAILLMCRIISHTAASRPTLVVTFCGYPMRDRKSTRLNSSHVKISYAVFCL